MWKRSWHSRLVWSKMNSAASKAKRVLGLMNKTFSSWSDEKHMSSIQISSGHTWNSLHYPETHINLTQKHKKVSYAEQFSQKNHTTFLTKKDSKWFDLKTKREKRNSIQIYTIVCGLEKVNLCDENKKLRPEQNITDRRHLFQLSRDRTSEN